MGARPAIAVVLMITVNFEPVAHLMQTGLIELGYEQWKIGNFQIEHPKEYGPDWESYQKKEDAGQLRFIAMREDEKLIGYISIELGTEIHNKELLMADIRDIYVIEGKKGYTRRLFGYAKKALKAMGITLMKSTHRLAGADPSAFYKALGAELYEQVYAWRL